MTHSEAECAQIDCPMCGQPVRVPSLEAVIVHYDLSDQQARLLSSLWRARGMPVPLWRIVDTLYGGGDEPANPSLAVKYVIHRLRGALKGSGFSVQHVGHLRGWRLVIGD